MSFEDLRVYQAAKRLTAQVDELTNPLPVRFRKAVIHIQKTLGQVEDGIAEACGQKTPAKMTYYLSIARGSVDEVRSQLTRLADRGALTKEQAKGPCILARTIAKMLTALIARIDDNPDDFIDRKRH